MNRTSAVAGILAILAASPVLSQAAVEEYLNSRATSKYGSGPLTAYSFEGVKIEVDHIDYDSVKSVSKSLFFNGGHFDLNNCASLQDSNSFTVTGSYHVGTSVTTTKMVSNTQSVAATINIPAGPTGLAGSVAATSQQTVTLTDTNVYSEDKTITISSPVTKTVAPMKRLVGDYYVLINELTQPIHIHLKLGGYVTEHLNIQPAHALPKQHDLSDFLAPEEQAMVVDGTVQSAFGSDLKSNVQEKPAVCNKSANSARVMPLSLKNPAKQTRRVKSAPVTSIRLSTPRATGKWAIVRTKQAPYYRLVRPMLNGPEVQPGPSGPTCAWIPQTVHQMAAQCGFNDLGVPKSATYQCGKDITCNDTCVFVSCDPDP